MGATGNDPAGSAYVFFNGYQNGDLCTTPSQCHSGHCTDGVCCDTDCGGGDGTDCQVCSVANGGTVDGTCALLASTVECRASAGECDVAETCTGSFACALRLRRHRLPAGLRGSRGVRLRVRVREFGTQGTGHRRRLRVRRRGW